MATSIFSGVSFRGDMAMLQRFPLMQGLRNDTLYSCSLTTGPNRWAEAGERDGPIAPTLCLSAFCRRSANEASSRLRICTSAPGLKCNRFRCHRDWPKHQACMSRFVGTGRCRLRPKSAAVGATQPTKLLQDRSCRCATI
jgi:hypothetical protein